MERKIKRTITEVLDYETGECIDANQFFKKPLDEITIYRSRLQQAVENFIEPIFGCYYCKQKIRIRGGISVSDKRKVEMFHFAHLKDSEDCHIKTKSHFTKEEVDRIKYNGAKESPMHQTLKNQIAESLRRNEITKREITFVEVEKVIRDKVAKEWKKPDINAFFKDKRIAIELQLSTTWLDVITRRQHFYKEQGIYIFWVFHTFSVNDDIRKLTYNDVVYTNNQNAYIFDNDTYELSKAENDLHLKCFYKIYKKDKLKLSEHWENSIVKLSDLTFDEQKFRIFYHDSEKQKKLVELEIEEHIIELKELERLKILKEQEQEIKKQEELKKKEELKSKIQEIKDNIKAIDDAKKAIELKEIKSRRKLSDLNDFSSKIAQYTDKTVNYFADQLKLSKPFYDYEDLLENLKVEFAEQIKLVHQTNNYRMQEEGNATKSLIAISKLGTIEISGKIYSIISNTADWAFIKKNYSQIKIIQKSEVGGLFAEDFLKSIRTDYELNSLQYAKDVHFLKDFSSQVVEFEKIKSDAQEIIKQQEIVLVSLKDHIKSKIELHLQAKIKEVETKLKNYEGSQKKLTKEKEKMKNKLNKFY